MQIIAQSFKIACKHKEMSTLFSDVDESSNELDWLLFIHPVVAKHTQNGKWWMPDRDY